MKLSLKELELIKRGLNQVTCTGDPTYKKICKKIHRKRCRKEIKKTEYTLALANKSFKDICDLFNSQNKETLEELSRDIPAITSIYNESGCSMSPYNNYTITLDVGLLRKGDGQRIFNFKDQNPDVNIKIE